MTDPITSLTNKCNDSGPWHMFAPAMDTRNKCGEAKGIFEIKGAKLEPKFFFNYLDIKEGRYRLRMLVHLPGKSFDVKNLRGCVELDFDVVN
ncbi:CLUMA_CG006819, isoform A [Clunio marinus]|uniref:CLUMA_CG006819, isoform A n=1 Tax=Clunio marinus TaxID=568069 RepID=A0A1J1I116_9DIPT|nr:CLUMA_CG006819, isoform A [Clunio marinus]